MKRSEMSEDQYCAKMMNIFGDDLTSHMHNFLHSYKTGEKLSNETQQFFANAFEKYLRARKGVLDASPHSKRKALADALGLSKPKKGRPNLEGIRYTIEFKLAWQVHMILTDTLDREGNPIKPTEAIKYVAEGMNQSVEVVTTARHKQRRQVSQRASAALALYEESVIPKRRSIEIAQHLIELAATPINEFETPLLLNRQETGHVLSFPPKKEVLGGMMIGHDEEGDLARVLSACTTKPQEVFGILRIRMKVLELVSLGEQMLQAAILNLKKE